MNQRTFSTKSEFCLTFVILLLALFLRLFNFMDMKANDPIFDLPVVDSKEYTDNAGYYNEVTWLGKPEPYYHPPLYSYFVGAIFVISQ